MTAATAPHGTQYDGLIVRTALERGIRRRYGPERSIAHLDRRPSPYRSSYDLEEIDATLDDGTLVPLIFKDVGRAAMSDAARSAKPEFVIEPRRELATYRWIVGPERMGTPALFEAVDDGIAGRHWLFIERVAGHELHQVGDAGVWARVARWLGVLHSRLAPRARELIGPPLLYHGANLHRAWMTRAATFAAASEDPERVRLIDTIASRYESAVARVARLPVTFIHGEFYASNIVVQVDDTGAQVRVAPIDWEMAGVGPGLLDLAALVAGRWNDEERSALVSEYSEALSAEYRIDRDTLATSLDACRLILAVQWLGWSRDWIPPPHRAHDWLGEAVELAERFTP